MREAYEDFLDLDTIPMGINNDTLESHRDFIKELGLPFDLLMDDNMAVAQRYDAVKPEGGAILRTVVIVGKDGRVIFRERGAPEPATLLEAIRQANDKP